MADPHTFWAELDALPMDDTPLTAAEADRLSAAVLEKVHNKAAAKKTVHRAKKVHHLPLWGRVLAGAAACMAVLCGVTSVNPALAEGLPFVGDVFSFLNQQRFKTQLQSDQLAAQAQPTAVPAVPDAHALPQTGMNLFAALAMALSGFALMAGGAFASLTGKNARH